MTPEWFPWWFIMQVLGVCTLYLHIHVVSELPLLGFSTFWAAKRMTELSLGQKWSRQGIAGILQPSLCCQTTVKIAGTPASVVQICMKAFKYWCHYLKLSCARASCWQGGVSQMVRRCLYFLAALLRIRQH